MPCCFFEPLSIALSPTFGQARIPLIDEYEGACHAGHPPSAAPVFARFRYCNHGYSRGECPHYPLDRPNSAWRYHVIGRTPGALELLCIEEVEHAPGRQARVLYDIAGKQLAATDGEPLMRAQAVAFARSYLRRFASSTE